MITLHPAGSTSFTTLGIGSLKDYTKGTVIEEINGIFELTINYPTTGVHYNEIQLRKIIYCKPNPYSKPQPFRVYSISKPINRIVTINACHVSYDLSDYPVNEFKANSAQDAMVKLKANSQVNHPFTFNSTVNATGEINVESPRTTRYILGNNIQTAYPGEFEFDNFMVYHRQKRGMNRGVSIRYGKNLLDITQEESISNVYTGVYPYIVSTDRLEDGTDITTVTKLPERIVNVEGTFDFTRILPLDMGTFFTGGLPTESQLREATIAYIRKEQIGIPKVSLELSSVQLPGSTEELYIGDTVLIEFIEARIDATSRCIKTVYDIGTNRYESVTFGEAVSNLATSISDTNKNIANKVDQQKIHFDAEIGNIKIDYAEIEVAIIGKANIDWVSANYAHLLNGYIDTAQIKDASIGTAQIGDLQVTVAKIQNAFVDSLVANQGTFKSAHIGVLTSDNIDANTITADYIKAVVIDAINLNVAGKIKADRIDTTELVVDNIDAGAITTGSLSSDVIKGNVISAINLSTETATIGSAKIGSLSADKITTGSLSSDVIKTNVISAINASIGIIDADKIDVDNLVVKNIDAGSITTGDLDAIRIQATVISAINSYAGTAKIKQAQIDSLKVGNANITDLDATKITAGKIIAKYIDATDLQIASGNVSGTFTANKIVGGILDATTITVTNLNADSITVGKINGTQIAQNTIGEGNLDTILSGKIDNTYDNVNQLLEDAGILREEVDVVNANAIKSVTSYFANSTSATIPPEIGWSIAPPEWTDGYYIWEKIQTVYLNGTIVVGSPVNITGAKGEDSIDVEIQSTNGNIFKNGEISTILIAVVKKGITDITDTIDTNRFRWTRVSKDPEGDIAWNTSNFGGKKTITITKDDVYARAIFNCDILD